jgi:hypothetical protein
MKPLLNAKRFLLEVRARMKFGELSRMPLRLLRFEIRGEFAECEWIARQPDVWDADIPRKARENNETLQTLKDAIKIRELLFAIFPDVRSAELRVYRQSVREPPGLVIAGTVNREDRLPLRIKSLVMEAKLYGFSFALENGALKARPAQQATDMELATQ